MEQLTLQRVKIKFRDNIETVVGENQAHVIDEAYDQYSKTGNDRLVKLPNGVRILISNMVSITPFVDEGLAANSIAQENMRRIERMMNTPRTEKQKWWKDRISENVARNKKGLPWIYYDVNGEVCTKDEARISFNILA